MRHGLEGRYPDHAIANFEELKVAGSGWRVYFAAKRGLCSGAIDLDSDSFVVRLFASSSNAGNLALSTIASVTGEVGGGTGYAAKAINAAWVAGSSSGQMRFTTDAAVWLAVGGPISGVKHAAISTNAGKLLCVAELSASQFDVADGTTLTVGPTAAGIFTLG